MPTLHWLTREEDLKASGRAPYRLLNHVETYGDANTENMIIQGDNLDGLKALLPYYAGKVKCIYIDPPYNTRSAFEHYDDNLEHTVWLSMMYPRLELLRELLSEDGSIWVTLDNNESHYLKIISDEIFGRANFIAEITWWKRTSPANDAKYFSSDHDNIIAYAKSLKCFSINRLERSEAQNKFYKNPDNDVRGPWNSVTYTGNKTKEERPNLYYGIINPNTGSVVFPPPGLTWRYGQETHKGNEDGGLLYWGKNGISTIPRLKMFLAGAEAVVPRTIWLAEDVGSTQASMTEQKILFIKPFGTPKPERLIQRVLHIATNPGDLVLDSFLGSGTTAAVAHKMGRRYIGIEIGEHAVTHCIPRLQKVTEGEQGGISKAVNWQGGGGFRFYRLGEAIFDDDGTIRKGIRFPQLAAHVWFSETKTPWQGFAEASGSAPSPLLGTHEGTAYYLLYNGILKDKSVNGGNVLTSKILEALPKHDGPKVIYGERCLFSPARLKSMGITFKHTPYDIKGR